jgi:hypothetical protein
MSRDQYRYSDAFKMFSLSIQSLSNVAYEFMRHFLPFPSQRPLRKQFSARTKQYASSLQSPEKIPDLLSELALPANTPCTLCIDAFSVDVFQGKSVCCKHAMNHLDIHLTDCEQIMIIADAIKRRNERDQQCSSENSIFLFLVSPLNVNHRVFPIHLKSHSSGSADAAIRSLWCRVIDIVSLHPSIQLKFCSVDGDQSYQTYSTKSLTNCFPAPAQFWTCLQLLSQSRSDTICLSVTSCTFTKMRERASLIEMFTITVNRADWGRI